MITIEEATKRVRDNPEDIEAWEHLRDQVDDPQKRKDCQEQIDRVLGQKLSLICPQYGTQLDTYRKLHDKTAHRGHIDSLADRMQTTLKVDCVHSTLYAQADRGFLVGAAVKICWLLFPVFANAGNSVDWESTIAGFVAALTVERTAVQVSAADL